MKNSLTGIILYSWRNNTENISYFLECFSLLKEQKSRGDICTCIVNNQPYNALKYLRNEEQNVLQKIILN